MRQKLKRKLGKNWREMGVRTEKKKRQVKKPQVTHSFLKNSRLLIPSSTEAISVTKIPL